MTPFPPKILVIKDSSVVIDLVDAGLLQSWFALGIPTITTDMVASELRIGTQWSEVKSLIADQLLTVESFKSSEIVEIVKLSKHHGISTTDGSVLFLSQKKSATLLTGDGKLRTACSTLKIDVRGTLWIFDQLVEGKVISSSRAAAALNLILLKGARLPHGEVEKRLQEWAK